MPIQKARRHLNCANCSLMGSGSLYFRTNSKEKILIETPKHMENTPASSSGSVSPEDQGQNTSTQSKCPVMHGAHRSNTNRDWWPNHVSLRVLHQHSPLSDPMGEEFDYATE